MPHPDRRQFLGSTLGAAALLGPLGMLPSWLRATAPGAPDGAKQRVLVVLQLGGGNDGLSTVTPWDDDLYYRGRPAISIPKGDLIRLDDLNGFHPSFRRLADRFHEGQMCIQQAVGYPEPNLSHFRSQDIWDTASTAASLPSTGWLGGLQDLLPGGPDDAVGMLAVGRDSMPLALRAEESVACVVPNLASYRIRNAPLESGPAERSARAQAIEALNAHRMEDSTRRLAGAYSAATYSLDEFDRLKAVKTRAAFPDHKLGHDLELVARAIGAGLTTRFFYVTHPGFDTHTDQVGMQAELLDRMDSAVDAFLEELKNMGRADDVVVMCITDFGRRVEECGIGETAGSDHGAANSMMLFGHPVNAGLHGGQPDLENLDEIGNLVMRADFRQVYADVIQNWLGADPGADPGADTGAVLGTVLGADFQPVKVIAT